MFETPIIRRVDSFEASENPPLDTRAKVLVIQAQTDIGPLAVRITEIAAVELAALLASHPRTRGSA